MKRILEIILVAVVSTLSCPAQNTTPKSLIVGAGISLPMAPRSFYDYWHPGITAETGIVTWLSDGTCIEYLLDYNRFSYDSGRLAQRLKSPASTVSVNGAGSSLFSLSMNYRFLPFDLAIGHPYLLIGGGVVYSILDKGTMNYVGYSVSNDSQSHTALCIPFGFAFEFKPLGDIHPIFETRYTAGLIGDKSFNGHYLAFRAATTVAL